jgi:acetyl esterase
VNYRLAPTHPYPAAIADVCDAYAWMVKNASSYGGDLSRVVLAGESAGANLVSSLTAALTYPRSEPHAKVAWDTGVIPRAVVPACGLFQVSDMERLSRRKPNMPGYLRDMLPGVSGPYLGNAPRDASLDLCDPLVLFERGQKPERPLPPFFLPVGTRDPLLDDTRRMGKALRALGTTAEERYYPGEVHAFHAFVMRKAARACWADTYAFLDRHVPRAP